MVRRIFFSVCGEGCGHSSRDMALARELTNSGCEVLMGSYGYALDRMKRNFNTVEIGKELEMVGKEGIFDLKATIAKSLRSALFFHKTISHEIKIIEDFKADCVVSDIRASAVLAASRLGIPCIIISNQTSLEHFFKSNAIFLRLFGNGIELMMERMMALADEVLIPDFPPPYTVCNNTLTTNRHVMNKQRFIGPVVSMKFENQIQLDPPEQPFILILLGGHSFRFPIINCVLKVADRFPDFTFIVFTQFKGDKIPNNVKILEFVEDISSYLNSARLIITQAGHTTAMEILTFGKPALIIPDKGQSEQEINAARMKELGVCETLYYPSLDIESLFKKINMLLNDSRFQEKAKKYSEMAKKIEGCKKGADIILKLSVR